MRPFILPVDIQLIDQAGLFSLFLLLDIYNNKKTLSSVTWKNMGGTRNDIHVWILCGILIYVLQRRNKRVEQTSM